MTPTDYPAPPANDPLLHLPMARPDGAAPVAPDQ